jgi:hypothetical protein
MMLQAHMDQAREERPRRQNDRPGPTLETELSDNAKCAISFQEKIIHALLQEPEVWLALELGPNGPLVELAIGLGARRSNRRTLTGIQDTKLYPGVVRSPGHDPPQRINLLDQMAFSDATDGWVTRHLAQGFYALRQKEGSLTHARGGQRRLGAGVAPTHDDDIQFYWEKHEEGCVERAQIIPQPTAEDMELFHVKPQKLIVPRETLNLFAIYQCRTWQRSHRADHLR